MTLNSDSIKNDCLHFIALILKKNNFEKINKQTLLLFQHAFLLYFSNFLKTLKIRTIHSGRSKITNFDILKFHTESESLIYKIIKIIPKKINKIKETKEAIQNVDSEIKNESDFSIAQHINKYVHIYDHLPKFPPSHTFRRTIQKENLDFSCNNLKKRIEQSFKAEKNLFKMVKIGKFVNFLHPRDN